MTESPAEPSLVLLVEDDEALAGILAAYLRAHHLRVTVAPTAESARAALSTGLRPNLIVLDINLPGDTGWTLLGSDAIAQAGHPPVVVASAMSINPARLRDAGVAGYLPKPFALDTLRATVERLTAPESADR